MPFGGIRRDRHRLSARTAARPRHPHRTIADWLGLALPRRAPGQRTQITTSTPFPVADVRRRLFHWTAVEADIEAVGIDEGCGA